MPPTLWSVGPSPSRKSVKTQSQSALTEVSCKLSVSAGQFSSIGGPSPLVLIRRKCLVDLFELGSSDNDIRRDFAATSIVDRVGFAQYI